MPAPAEAQSLAVKRAEVEFHNFASFGEPERAIAAYEWENERRQAFIRKYLEFIGPMSPFLEIGASAGHTSYLLTNEFGANGFALDISAGALRHGQVLMDRWGLSRAPIRVAGDALNLPFKNESIRFVMAFQMLSQFMDIESVFLEVKRVLAPGGVFLFAEEPARRLLSLRLYRCPYYQAMRPWERRLYQWGLLGYLVKDVVGAHQEESFGIRQNHTMNLKDWQGLIQKHFVAHEMEILVPERGWGESWIKKLALSLDPHRSLWRAARLLGGSVSAVCRKEGSAPAEAAPHSHFENLLRCPDCAGRLVRDANDNLLCGCGYRAANEGGVYNLLRSRDRAELYPGDREDVIDFCLPQHESRLLEGWYELEGVFGNRYRWIGPHASARLKRCHPGRQRLRIRGHAHELAFAQHQPVRIEAAANGQRIGQMTLSRAGLFIFEADLPEANEYKVDIFASPVWQAPPDDRFFTVTLSMIRLAPT